MTVHYLIHSPSTGRTLKVSYKGGNFFRLEKTVGKTLNRSDLVKIADVIPLNESGVSYCQERYPKLEYTKLEKEVGTYQKYVSAWFSFYDKFMGISPKFTSVDGKHLNQIKAYLTKIGGTDTAGLELFELILANWETLDDFHKDNTDLKYINSRLNPILNAIKKAGKTTVGGTDYSVGL